MIRTHLPILQVILPLLAAPLCVILRQARLAWVLASFVGYLALLIAVILLHDVLANGVLVYEIGGWAAPWGIEYRIDEVNALVLLIVTGVNAAALPFARESVEREIDPDRIYLFYASWMLCLTGLVGITVTGDAFNVFVFLEISSLSAYTLVSLGEDRRALLASFRYLVMGTIGATFILIAIGLLYMTTGTLNMLDLAERLPALAGNRTLRVAFGFLIVGVGIKMALFPMHMWLPDAYTYAPSAVSIFLAATATKVAVYVLLRFVFGVFGAHFAFNTMGLDGILIPLALVGIFVGSTLAIYQQNIKRLLAYSSVAQVGYIALGIGLANLSGLTAAIVHLFNHALIKAALFMALGCVVYRTGGATFSRIRGLGAKMPFTMAAFVVGGFSLIGVPATVGFISKWTLIVAAGERGSWWIAVAVLGSSLLAVIYIWRVVEAAYFQPCTDPERSVTEAPLSLLIPTWTLIIANLYFGLDTTLTIGVATRAASLLLGGGS